MVGSVIIDGDSARWMETRVVIEIKQTHSLSKSLSSMNTHAHTHWNDAKPWGTGLVNLLIGCVF